MALKTYILAPNFTFGPDGPIRIGNIIADPFYPTKFLSRPANFPPTTTHIDFDCSFSQDSNKSLQGSVWAQFLQHATGNISRKVNRDVSSEYNIESLETIRIKEDPSDEEVTERIKEPRVRSAIKAGLSGAAPVYMITGLKVAKGFRLNKRVITSTEKTSIRVGFPVAAGAGVGTDISVSRSETTSESFKSGSSIIFAYQVHKIAQKGWLHKRTEVDIYAPRAAFLNIDVHLEKEDSVMAKLCEVSDYLEAVDENEYPPLEIFRALDNEDGCNCIVFTGP